MNVLPEVKGQQLDMKPEVKGQWFDMVPEVKGQWLDTVPEVKGHPLVIVIRKDYDGEGCFPRIMMILA